MSGRWARFFLDPIKKNRTRAIVCVVAAEDGPSNIASVFFDMNIASVDAIFGLRSKYFRPLFTQIRDSFLVFQIDGPPRPSPAHRWAFSLFVYSVCTLSFEAAPFAYQTNPPRHN
jgi:hypothetical protein